MIFAKYIRSPDGVSVWNIFQQLKRIEKGSVGLASIKLERMGYIEKAIATNHDGNHYTVAIAADGIDYLLENEKDPTKEGVKDSTEAKEEFDDDIPF